MTFPCAEKYKDAVVVFDGHDEALSTKHHEHARRTIAKKVSADLNNNNNNNNNLSLRLKALNNKRIQFKI